MGRIAENVREAVEEERYLISEHAGERLDERGIPDWQVIAGVADATVAGERPRNRPHPVVELLQELPDGTRVKAVWAWLSESRRAKLVTVHYLD